MQLLTTVKAAHLGIVTSVVFSQDSRLLPSYVLSRGVFAIHTKNSILFWMGVFSGCNFVESIVLLSSEQFEQTLCFFQNYFSSTQIYLNKVVGNIYWRLRKAMSVRASMVAKIIDFSS